MNSKVSSSVVLVTGASSGFGKSFAELFARRGYQVFGTSRRADYSDVNGVTMIPMDVGHDDSVQTALDYIFEKCGKLDVLVNNAGGGIAGAVEDTSIEEAKVLFETNFFGVHRVCKLAIPEMRKQGSGHIINIGSLGGVVSIPFQAFYSASKAALASLSDGMSMELKRFGITVTRVEPGDYKTGFTDARVMVKASGHESVYDQQCSRAIEVMAHDEQNGADPLQLANKLLDIIESPKPKLVYQEGMFMQTFLVGLMAWLPKRLVEKLLMDTYKLND